MAVLRTVYDHYVEELAEAKERMRRDRIIIKTIHKMIKTKHLSQSENEKLQELIFKKSRCVNTGYLITTPN